MADIHDLSNIVHRQRMISVSMGLAVVPDNAIDSTTLIRAADMALYEAKRQGRDRIVIAPPNPLVTSTRKR